MACLLLCSTAATVDLGRERGVGGGGGGVVGGSSAMGEGCWIKKGGARGEGVGG